MKMPVSGLRAGDVIRDQALELRVHKVDSVVINVGRDAHRAYEITTYAGDRQGMRQYLPNAEVEVVAMNPTTKGGGLRHRDTHKQCDRTG